jgi:cytochrome c5
MLRLNRLTSVCLMSVLSFGAGAGASTTGYERDTRAYNLAHGRVVFNEHCLRCHEQGRKGAPMIAEAGDWVVRLQQPLDELIRHAINGHGEMPARGDLDLTDQQVAAAVAYVVNRTRLMVADQFNERPPTGAGSTGAAAAGSADDAVLHMFLLLLGKDRWK